MEFWQFAFQIISYITTSITKGPELSLLYKRFTEIIRASESFAINIPGTTYYKGLKVPIAYLHNTIELKVIITISRAQKFSAENKSEEGGKKVNK